MKDKQTLGITELLLTFSTQAPMRHGLAVTSLGIRGSAESPRPKPPPAVLLGSSSDSLESMWYHILYLSPIKLLKRWDLTGQTCVFLRVCMLSHSVVSDSAILWTVAHQAPPSMEFSRREYWSGLSFPSPGDLPDPGVEPSSLALAGEFFT